MLKLSPNSQSSNSICMENTLKFNFDMEIAVAIDHFTNPSLEQEMSQRISS